MALLKNIDQVNLSSNGNFKNDDFFFMLETMRSSYKMKVKTYFNKLCFVLSSRSTFTPIVTSEAGDFDGVERSSLQPRVS